MGVLQIVISYMQCNNKSNFFGSQVTDSCVLNVIFVSLNIPPHHDRRNESNSNHGSFKAGFKSQSIAKLILQRRARGLQTELLPSCYKPTDLADNQNGSFRHILTKVIKLCFLIFSLVSK